MQKQKVAIVGASDKPERYAYKAMKMLKQHGHEVYLVNPGLQTIEGEKVFASLNEIAEKIDTVTMYIGPKLSTPLEADILKLAPKRIIFNPGSENPNLAAVLSKNNVASLESCTLVMLRTNQFDI